MKVKGEQDKLWLSLVFNHATIYVDCEVIQDLLSVLFDIWGVT